MRAELAATLRTAGAIASLVRLRRLLARHAAAAKARCGGAVRFFDSLFFFYVA
jgi:hypothetical protein